MLRKLQNKGIFLSLTLFIVSCAGSASQMAAKKKGVTPRQIGRCEKRLCFMALGPEILETKTNDDGSLTEIYRVQRKRGSSLRSFTHGILSISNLGIWNVVGTPIEGYLSSDDFIVFRVFYDLQEKAKKVEVQG